LYWNKRILYKRIYVLNTLYAYNMSERIKEIDNTISGISKTGWRVII